MIIRVGDKILYRGSFGNDEPTEVIIEGIEICPRFEKYGEPAESANTSVDWCTLDLNNEHWCYGYQVVKVLK